MCLILVFTYNGAKVGLIVIIAFLCTEAGLVILRQRAKGPHIPSLYILLQYLEVTPNQEYLVQRLKGKLNVMAKNFPLKAKFTISLRLRERRMHE